MVCYHNSYSRPIYIVTRTFVFICVRSCVLQPRKTKKFIDKKSAVTFHLVHR